MSDPVPSGLNLQFDRAEFEGGGPTACASCKQSIGAEYYSINDQVVCPSCHRTLTATLTGGSGGVRFVRATVAAVVAGGAGSLVYFAISKLTGYEFALVAILVGWAVGYAVRWGCGGRGGALYQTLAVVITYLAIVTTYVPDIITGFREASQKEKDKAVAGAPATNASSSSPATPAEPAPATARADADRATFVDFLIAIGFLVAIACAAPFLAGLQNIIGLAIIAFGLWEAWKMNKRPTLVISGPHTIAPATLPPLSVG